MCYVRNSCYSIFIDSLLTQIIDNIHRKHKETRFTVACFWLDKHLIRGTESGEQDCQLNLLGNLRRIIL